MNHHRQIPSYGVAYGYNGSYGWGVILAEAGLWVPPLINSYVVSVVPAGIKSSQFLCLLFFVLLTLTCTTQNVLTLLFIAMHHDTFLYRMEAETRRKVLYRNSLLTICSAYTSYAPCPLCVVANNRHRQYESICSCCLLDAKYRHMLRGLLILDNHVKPDF